MVVELYHIPDVDMETGWGNVRDSMAPKRAPSVWGQTSIGCQRSLKKSRLAEFTTNCREIKWWHRSPRPRRVYGRTIRMPPTGTYKPIPIHRYESRGFVFVARGYLASPDRGGECPMIEVYSGGGSQSRKEDIGDIGMPVFRECSSGFDQRLR